MSNKQNSYKGVFYFSSSSESTQLTEINTIYGEAFSACYRANACWLKNAFVKTVEEIPSETQFLLVKKHNCYTICIMLCDGNARSSLCVEGGKLYCRAETGDTATPLGQYAYMYVLDCANPYDGLSLAYEEINATLGSFTLKKDKRLPSFIDCIGFCTYNAFGSDVTHDKLISVEEAFVKNDLNLGFFIVDEGWFNSNDGKISGFEANPSKFPKGLSYTISECKNKYGLREFLCWHAYNGYWKGIDGTSLSQYDVDNKPFNIPDRLLCDNTSTTFSATAGGDFFPMNIAYQDTTMCRDFSAFYGDFYKALKSQGVDGTKIDAMAWTEAFAEGDESRVKRMKKLLSAVEAASNENFGGEHINCSSCSNDFFMNLGSGSVTRTSCDYLPDNPESQDEHIRDNAFVGFWTNPVVVADWDMFETSSSWGEFHAAARAISGGPIYCTDKPENADFSLIKKLCAKDGTVVRAVENAKPTVSCLFGARKGEPFRVFNKTQNGYVLGVFGNADCNGAVSIPVSEINGLPAGKYAVYSSRNGFVGELSHTDKVTCDLEEKQVEIFTLVPIVSGIAVIGLVEKFNPSAFIQSITMDAGVATVHMIEEGVVGIYKQGEGYSEQSGKEIEISYSILPNNPVKPTKTQGSTGKKSKLRAFFTPSNLSLYLLMLPTLVYIFVFNYLPLSGLVMAFQDFKPLKGLFGSDWTDMYGFKHFYNFITMPDFWNILKNTLVLSVYSIAINTVLPIILALFINEIRGKIFKKTVQTISYAPYFVSVAVLCGMLFSFSNYDNGIFNRIITFFGGERIRAMESASLFPHLYVWSGVWQGLGWWAIIYVGTLANVDQSLHEAAIIDGAGRLKRMWHINLPAIIPMTIIMFILSIGSMLSVGFEKVYLMQTPTNLSASRIISTYVYEVTFDSQLPKYSYATAIGLFNSIINILLLWVANTISRKVGETSLW